MILSNEKEEKGGAQSPSNDLDCLSESPPVSPENQRTPGAEVEPLAPPPYPADGGFANAGAHPAHANTWEGTPSSVPSVHGTTQSLSAHIKSSERRWWLDRRALLTIGLVIGAISVAACAVFPPVYFKVIKPRNDKVRTRGWNGSRVLTEDGTEFVYLNPFGGFWVHDPGNPYNDSAQPNSWTPPLNEPWNFETHRIHGVNLGGLFVLENLTAPTLFEKYPGVIDEWTLSLAMANDPHSGGLNQIEEHYRTFITEQDIAEIAGAGLTWVRIPIGFWAIETFPGEPFLARTSWKYIVRALQWCRKYGLRVNLSLYTVPGTANGSPRGGRWGQFGFLRGVMGLSNAQRALYYIRVLAEFVSQPEWTNVVPMLSILEAPADQAIGLDTMRSFFIEAYRVVREVTGYGAGRGPYLVLYDGWDQSSDIFNNSFMAGADRVILERHIFFEWHDARNLSLDAQTVSSVGNMCRWGPLLNQSRSLYGITISSEFTASFLNCGDNARSPGDKTYQGECSTWLKSDDWGLGIVSSLHGVVSAQMDALADYFFYTWKVGTTSTGDVEYPLWSYQLGHRNGWIPNDPRQAQGACQRVLSAPSYTVTVPQTWDGTYKSAWMTGRPAASTLTDASSYPWPPSSIAGTGYGPTPLSLPTYTSTGSPIILPGLTFTNSKGEQVDLRPSRTTMEPAPAPTTVAGCNYPDAWDAVEIDFTQVCTSDFVPTPTASNSGGTS